MCKMYRRSAMLVVAVAIVGFSAGVQAEVIYNYDFSQVSPTVNGGALSGQDLWINQFTTTTLNVVASGSSLWSGNYVTTTTASGEYTMRPNTDSFFTLVNNRSFDVSALYLVNGTSYGAFTGLFSNAHAGMHILNGVHGGYSAGPRLGWTIMGNAYYEVDLSNISNKVFRVGVDVTALGSDNYSAQRYYENVTDGTGRVDQGTAFQFSITDITNYWDRLQVRTLKTGTQLDEVKIAVDVVPEPSTLALLACGLIGLLAYAWRKRK